MHTSFPPIFAAGLSLTDYLPYIASIVAVFYFLLFRPQQKQLKEQQSLLSTLKKGDEVLTQSGLIGKIFAVADKVITLEIASGVKVRVLKSSVQGRVNVIEVADAPKANLDGDSGAKKDEK